MIKRVVHALLPDVRDRAGVAALVTSPASRSLDLPSPVRTWKKASCTSSSR
jgi:hypothetical protein